MFPSDGFKRIACPFQPTCHRQELCLFSHEIARQSCPILIHTGDDSKEKEHKNKKLKQSESVFDQKQENQELKIEQVVHPIKINQIIPSFQQSAIKVRNTTPPLPPRVISVINGPVSKAQRQKAVDNFYTQFQRIYVNVLLMEPRLAHDHSLAQELKLMKTASTKTYTNFAVGIQSRLKQRASALSISDIGIDGEYNGLRLILTLDSVRMFIADENILMDNCYPHSSLFMMPLEDTSIIVCERCDLVFSDGECIYHPGKLYTQKLSISATSEKAYLCCLKEAPHVGCETSRHVFKDDRLSVLHNRIPFVETNEEIHDTTLDICGMDCEMVYTTQGFELARLCVVDKEGITVIDELCKTKGCVIDLNTIYSGITTLQDAKYDLESLRDHLLTHVNKDTVVVGHGLENDLKVLRVYHFRNILYDSKVIHLTVIDTSILFPFPNRPTYKYGLKMLAKFYLGKVIQDSSAGHSPVEDAVTCVDLLRVRLSEGFVEHCTKDRNR